MSEQMNVVITGHVDHGKSTVIGRLMADTGSLPEGKLEQVKKECERNSKPFEYAFLLDALKDEQSQGITIDAARVFFKTEKRHYIIIDAPGHIEFLKNMITGAARAEAAFLVIDADEGVQENSKRHGYLLSMLGIRQLCVLVNKMDLVDYDRKVYKSVVRKYSRFLRNLDVENAAFIPVSGREGDNVSAHGENMPWWRGHTVLTLIDTFRKEKSPNHLPFRMPVQDVYKFTAYGDSRRIIAGSVSSGVLDPNDEVVFYPSGKKSRVKAFENFNGDSPLRIESGMAAGFTLEEQIYVNRGALAARVGDPPPHTGQVFRVNLFWLGREPLVKDKEYIFKTGTERVRARLFDTIKVIDASNLNTDGMKKVVERHDVADCVITTRRPVAVDLVEELPLSSRFVLVDEYEIAGGGIIREVIRDKAASVQDHFQEREFQWDSGLIAREVRSTVYGHVPALVLLGGPEDPRKAHFAKVLEKALFERGHKVYYLAVRNVRAGLDADHKSGRRIRRHHSENREELILKLSEMANFFLDAGIILLITVSGLTFDEREIFRKSVGGDKVATLWVGSREGSDVAADHWVDDPDDPEGHIDPTVDMLTERGFLHGQEKR